MANSPALSDLLEELAHAGARHDEQQTVHGKKRLNLETETARLLHLLLVSSRRKRMLEIGTSNGYSTLWIADALSSIPGAQPLITIERDPEKVEQARGNVARAGLGAWVDFCAGDASEIVSTLAGPFDAVFFDADRISAPEQLRVLLPRFEADVLLLADNARSHPDEIAGYLAAVDALPGFKSLVVPIGKGLHIAHRLA
jgi:predicted O-methyltransferase YrrM